jgi:hypothetical protein
VGDIAHGTHAGMITQLARQRKVAVGEHERRVAHAFAQPAEGGQDDVEVVERGGRPRAQDDRPAGKAQLVPRAGPFLGRRGPEPHQVDAEIDGVQPLGRRAASHERIAHVRRSGEHRVGALDRLVAARPILVRGEVDVRAPGGDDDRPSRGGHGDVSPTRQPVRVDDVGLDAFDDVHEPLDRIGPRVVGLDRFRHRREVDGAPARLLVTRDPDAVPECDAVLGPAPQMIDVQRPDLQHTWGRASDPAC